MKYYTIKDIEIIIGSKRKIIEIYQENNWVVVILDNGIKIKFRNF